MSKTTMRNLVREQGSAEYWRPMLNAVGVATADMIPEEIYRLSEIIWRDKEVARAVRELQNIWHHSRAAQLEGPLPPPNKLTLEEVMTWLPPDFTLQAIQMLPDARREQLRFAVMGALRRMQK